MTTAQIACPQCGKPIVIEDRVETVQCAVCRQIVVLQGHVCPNCYHVHAEETAVCQQCGESINRACKHCHTVNWGGSDQCRKCGQPLDIFEMLSDHSPKAAGQRLQRQMDEAHTFKKTEEEASRKRMAELQAVETERQIELQRRLKIKQRQERRMLAFAFAMIAIFLITVLIFVLLK